MKMNIGNWFKENFPKCIIKRSSLKNIVNMIRHEIIHYKIYKKFIKNSGIDLEMVLSKKSSLHFGYSAKCLGHYPLIYNLSQYYPKYLFVEFIQYLYDIIYSIFSLRIFNDFIPYTTYFIKTLFKFIK